MKTSSILSSSSEGADERSFCTIGSTETDGVSKSNNDDNSNLMQIESGFDLSVQQFRNKMVEQQIQLKSLQEQTQETIAMQNQKLERIQSKLKNVSLMLQHVDSVQQEPVNNTTNKDSNDKDCGNAKGIQDIQANQAFEQGLSAFLKHTAHMEGNKSQSKLILDKMTFNVKEMEEEIKKQEALLHQMNSIIEACKAYSNSQESKVSKILETLKQDLKFKNLFHQVDFIVKSWIHTILKKEVVKLEPMLFVLPNHVCDNDMEKASKALADILSIFQINSGKHTFCTDLAASGNNNNMGKIQRLLSETQDGVLFLKFFPWELRSQAPFVSTILQEAKNKNVLLIGNETVLDWDTLKETIPNEIQKMKIFHIKEAI